MQHAPTSATANHTLFSLPAERGRWLLIPLCMVVQLCLGTVYSWSIFRKPLEQTLKLGATESLLPFTVLLAVFAVLMPFAGAYIDRIGPRTLIAIGGAVVGLGYTLSGFATSLASLVASYGVIAGAGAGIVYGIPIAVSARWFPDRKGLAVGLTVAGFGLSPLITAPLARAMIRRMGALETLWTLGFVFGALIILIAPLLRTPPSGWRPAGWAPPAAALGGRGAAASLWSSSKFYGLWLCFTLGSFVGLAAIGISSPVGQEIVKLDAEVAAMSVSLFAIFNGSGRPLGGWLTDRIRPRRAALLSYVVILAASLLMLTAKEGSVVTYLIAFSMFWLSLGGWLAIAPTSTLMLFDPKDYAKNYGIVFTAYGAGALGGTLVAGRIRDLFGTYLYAFYPTAVLAVLGMLLAWFMLKEEA